MSTILEQAIIDAQALRTAALKNAETAILEKYGNEVRVAVESLLEQEEIDEQDIAIEADPVMVDEIPPAAGAGEKLCPCPDDGEQLTYTLNIKDLRQALDSMDGEEDMPMDQEDLAMRVAPEVEEEPEEDMAISLQEELELDEEIDLDETEELEEGELDIDEDMIQELVEELVVDMMPVKTGWLATPQGEMQYAEELELARRSGTEAQEQLKALQDAHDRLAITNESLTKKNRKLGDTISALKDKVEETLLENAKLLYMNQTLNSASLNERQKSKVVESIRKADSVEEAKVIFETLQGAVGEVNASKPKSLSEAIKRPSMTMPRRRAERASRESVLKERFQRLAGISKTE
jgi:hypothetical protein